MLYCQAQHLEVSNNSFWLLLFHDKSTAEVISQRVTKNPHISNMMQSQCKRMTSSCCNCIELQRVWISHPSNQLTLYSACQQWTGSKAMVSVLSKVIYIKLSFHIFTLPLPSLNLSFPTLFAALYGSGKSFPSVYQTASVFLNEFWALEIDRDPKRTRIIGPTGRNIIF